MLCISSLKFVPIIKAITFIKINCVNKLNNDAIAELIKADKKSILKKIIINNVVVIRNGIGCIPYLFNKKVNSISRNVSIITTIERAFKLSLSLYPQSNNADKK